MVAIFRHAARRGRQQRQADGRRNGQQAPPPGGRGWQVQRTAGPAPLAGAGGRRKRRVHLMASATATGPAPLAGAGGRRKRRVHLMASATATGPAPRQWARMAGATDSRPRSPAGAGCLQQFGNRNDERAERADQNQRLEQHHSHHPRLKTRKLGPKLLLGDHLFKIILGGHLVS